MTSPLHILRAAWIAPMASPLLRDGAVAIADGRITDVGPAAEVITRHPSAAVEDLGDTVLMPGLVNPHVHLELSDLTPADPPASFVDWLLAVMAKGPAPSPEGEARVAAATQAGIEQCLRFGVTTVGDITRFPHVTRQVLADSPLRAVSFGEVTAMASRRHLLDARLAAAMTPSPAPERVVSAVSPHAPYSIELAGYLRCIKVVKNAGVPIASHVAESADEAEFLTTHAGPFRRLWNTIGGWDEKVPLAPPGTTAIDHIAGLLRYAGGIVVHANHLTPGDVDLLAARRASVVFCPRTHAFFGHPPHLWRTMLARGINVAVGTDSTASSPDLNLVDDLRLLHAQSPEVPVETLWQLATTNAARAMMMAGRVGELSPGAWADLALFPATTDRPLLEVLTSGQKPIGVWIAGRRVR